MTSGERASEWLQLSKSQIVIFACIPPPRPERIKYGGTSAVDLGTVAYLKYAQAFGATGLQIRDADEIAPTLKKAFDIAGPVLIEVHVDYRDNAKLFEDVHEGMIM